MTGSAANSDGSWKNPRIAFAVAIAGILLIYLPDLGHGFVRDDFMWVREGRVRTAADLARLFAENVGFYRPLVSTTFAADYALFGLHPFAYGATNLLLLLVCAVLLVRLAAALQLDPVAATAAAAIWLFNFHGVSMSLLWFSGRTALLLCLFGLLMALAMVRGQRWRAALWCFLALLSKEEAVAFPVAMAAWSWYELRHQQEPQPVARAVRAVWPLFLALAVYIPLRQHAGAFGYATAPSYYRLVTSASLLLRNVAEYSDRAGTVSAAAALLVVAAARRLPSFSQTETRVAVFGAMWLIAGFALTLFVPVRSDLYALNPSVGTALVAAAAIQSLRDRAVPVRRALIVLLALPFLLLPVYRERNRRAVLPADLSQSVLADLQHRAGALPDGTHIVLLDDDHAAVNLTTAFGDLLQDAVAVGIGRRFTAEIADGAAPAPDASAHAPAVTYRLVDGRLEPLEAVH